MKLQIEDVIDDSVQAPAGPPPPRELGLHLETIEDARTWLNHPSNWRNTRTFIIIWDGLVPYISAHHGQRLLNEPWDTGMYEVVVKEQRRLRRGGKQDSAPAETSEE